LFLFANGFLEFGGIEGVVEPGGEDEEEDDQKGDDVGARSFGGSGHGRTMRCWPGEGGASNGATARAGRVPVIREWCAVQGSNLRPLPCEGNALPLS
jgi:hypothetical protein